MNTSSHNSPHIIVGLLAIILLAGTASVSAEWKTGKPLPDLKSYMIEGSLPDNLAGKVLLVDFWASWCSPCKASFPVLNQLHQKYSSSGLVIIAINEDDKAEAMKAYLAENIVSFTVIRDVGHKLVAAAAVETMPMSFLVDRSGKIRFIHTGFHGEKTKEQYTREIELLLKEEAPK